jgi:hypothetical protein
MHRVTPRKIERSFQERRNRDLTLSISDDICVTSIASPIDFLEGNSVLSPEYDFIAQDLCIPVMRLVPSNHDLVMVPSQDWYIDLIRYLSNKNRNNSGVLTQSNRVSGLNFELVLDTRG